MRVASREARPRYPSVPLLLMPLAIWDCAHGEVSQAAILLALLQVSGKISSQYLSALLMASPYAESDVEIEITDTLVSVPYVLMTIKLMERFGVVVENLDNKVFKIAGNQKYKAPGRAFVEGDASSASYFLGGGAITGGPVTVVGCGKTSLQGDVEFANVLGLMGAKVSSRRAHSVSTRC